MTQEKLRRVVVAATVAGTILFVILLSVLVYQFIKMDSFDKRIENLEQENAQLEQESEDLEGELKDVNSDLGKLFLAIKEGFVFENGK